MNTEKSSQIFQRTMKKNHLTEAAIYAENLDGTISWNEGYNRTIDSPMNMASITKLFVTTCILQLVDQKKMQLEDKISQYLGDDIVKGLHIYHGVDYSYELTIYHLLSHTSGLPDYFLKKRPGGKSFEKLLWEEDYFVPFDEMISTCKAMKSVFKPGKPGRSYYADINFDLLGKILENIYELPLAEIYEKQIFKPLGLTHTYAVSEKNNFAPFAYRKGKAYSICNFLRSCPASGGGVTTARELMIFLKAFWSGKLFSKDIWKTLTVHNRLQLSYGCVEYSVGHMYIHAGYLFDKRNTLRGHSGASGSFAYYCEETGMFYVGDLNDSRVYLPVNMLIKIELCFR